VQIGIALGHSTHKALPQAEIIDTTLIEND
jgi:hypothetical protein